MIVISIHLKVIRGEWQYFFNNTKTNVIVHNQISSIDGNLLALDLSLNKQRFNLVNIYGPSDRDTPVFFQQLESIL